MLEISFSQLFYFIETVGVMAFALSGYIKARQHNFDFVGAYILALITAFGGGTIRDLVLDNQPVYWIAHSEYPLFLFFLIAGLSLIKRNLLKPNWLFVPDALGMSFFAITAAQSAYQAGYSFIIVGILATIVASFGGVIRDSLCQETPIIFKKSSNLSPLPVSIPSSSSFKDS